MNDFGRVMVFNSKAVEGGDLVAANIAAKPLENLGTIARLFVIGRLFSSAPHYNSVLKQYRRMSQGKDVRTKAEILGTLLLMLLDLLYLKPHLNLFKKVHKKQKNKLKL